MILMGGVLGVEITVASRDQSSNIGGHGAAAWMEKP